MLSIDQITHLHLELSTLCNARCPACPRNIHGYSFNDGYPECNLTLENIKKILSEDFLKQIKHIYISGNFGDFMMNPESLAILEYLRNSSPRSWICVGTNGGANSESFWQRVAELTSEVVFCIDGLQDTHSIYRKNTVYNTVIKNAQTVINNNGRTSWKFIVFDHNKHQIEEARQLSIDLGFTTFFVHDHGRNQTPVFDKYGNFEYWIGKKDLDESNRSPKIEWFLEAPIRNEPPTHENYYGKPATIIKCQHIEKKELYIAANGEVYPCCFMGHYPHTFQRNMSTWFGHANGQLSKIATNNNALDHGIEKAIEWFNTIPNSWNKKTFADGQLIHCASNCGNDNPYQFDKTYNNKPLFPSKRVDK
jgi:MoaA/NifB/PqqE/SkfB family radical SAM enzyme